MTPAQEKRFYFPLWHRACIANAWRMQKGRIELALEPPEPANSVISVARALADQEHRAVTLDDLRHATHVIACERNCSHRHLRNHELNRWKWLMHLLIDPDDLNATRHWLNKELDEDESLCVSIERMPKAIVRSIARNRFEVADWHDLGLEDKRSLLGQLRNRMERALKCE